MSLRLLTALVDRMHLPHTPLDDLESFIWVLCWASLSVLNNKGVLNEEEERFWDAVSSKQEITQLKRYSFSRTMKRPGGHNVFSKAFGPFGSLLLAWLSYTNDMEDIGPNPDDPITLHETAYRQCYEDFLKIGFEHLDGLPTSWNYF